MLWLWYGKKITFIGDQVRYIKCYDIKLIFDFCDKGQTISKKFNKSISIDVQTYFEKIKFALKWKIEAHKSH